MFHVAIYRILIDNSPEFIKILHVSGGISGEVSGSHVISPSPNSTPTGTNTCALRITTGAQQQPTWFEAIAWIFMHMGEVFTLQLPQLVSSLNVAAK